MNEKMEKMIVFKFSPMIHKIMINLNLSDVLLIGNLFPWTAQM